ncbi:MAG: argininosuccinate lyase [Bacteroidales bacterium]|nr:argininosuccinate lyase [Bacteroidales bacterium]
MATLWNKGTCATSQVENFTVGNDRVLDLRLARYDVLGSIAHITMLESIGLLSGDELSLLKTTLEEILSSVDSGEFRLEDDVEDIHSQVELLLTRKLGDVGKKIHSGRSRNDQVLVDLKLFLRDELLSVRGQVLSLFGKLQALSGKYKDVLLPGYTHAQLAMPSSFGLWFGAYAESLVNDMYMLHGAYMVVNRNPLGSAAGYGNSFPLNREMTTELLGFASMDYNSVAAQLSRGKSERCVASAIGSVALTLNKFASDCCMYMCPNFGFIHFPDSLTTGSSIMPHKKNPDVWEMVRGKCNRVLAVENEISLMCSNMPHGYHRDYQLLKDVLFPALELVHECLDITSYMLDYIQVNENIVSSPLYEHLFTVEEVNRRVLSGVPFRDAYRQVGQEVNSGTFHYGPDTDSDGDGRNLTVDSLNHTHAGSVGNLCNDRIADLMTAAADW